MFAVQKRTKLTRFLRQGQTAGEKDENSAAKLGVDRPRQPSERVVAETQQRVAGGLEFGLK